MKITINEKKLLVGSNYALGGNTLHNTTKGSNELKPCYTKIKNLGSLNRICLN